MTDYQGVDMNKGTDKVARIVEVLIEEGGMTREDAERIAPSLARAGVTVAEVAR